MAVKLKFHGAARTVTGSCYMIDTGSARVLVDCGMFQGSRSETELNYRPFPFDPKAVDALVLTHAHIDHTGLVPKLVKHGFAGAIHATPATAVPTTPCRNPLRLIDVVTRTALADGKFHSARLTHHHSRSSVVPD